MDLPDIQNQKGDFGCEVDAGVTDIQRPVHLSIKGSDECMHTVAQVTLTVHLPHNKRGVNMSRLPIAINSVDWDQPISKSVGDILRESLRKTKSLSAEVALAFPYFLEMPSPVTDHSGVLSVDCMIGGRMHRSNIADPFRTELVVTTPVMTLCPCSKAISKNSAHNQRAKVQTKVYYLSDEIVWIEDLVQVATEAASSRVYPIVKREDEKWITEHAYNNPKFVEDVVRGAAYNVEQIEAVLSYEIQVISEESIHDHCAIANVQG